MNKKEAKEITGGLSAPGKMPEGAYSISAVHCKTGAKLRLVKDTPCYGCYALKNRYIMPIQAAALERRFQSLDHPQWVQAMAVLIKGKKFFRWHDSRRPAGRLAPGQKYHSKSASSHQGPCTGCQLKRDNTYRFRVQAYQKI